MKLESTILISRYKSFLEMAYTHRIHCLINGCVGITVVAKLKRVPTLVVRVATMSKSVITTVGGQSVWIQFDEV